MDYRSSALTTIGHGTLGVFTIAHGGFFLIVPLVVEAYGYDASVVPVLRSGSIVALGIYAEFPLPVLTFLVLRRAALGMIGIVVVQSWLEVAFHGVDAATVGALFDRAPGSIGLDQRALLVFLLAYLAVKGARAVSLYAALCSVAGRPRLPA